MAQATWTLVPRLRPERAEDHARLLGELERARKDLAGVGLLGRLLVPARGRRHIELKSRVAKLERELAACFGKVGYDLDPPRIGIDEKATAWYREFLSRDADAWPLPVAEMIDEMKGQPVWELAGHREVQHLDVGWPTGGFPVPTGPGLSGELARKLDRTLSPEDAVALSEPLRDAVVKHFRTKYPALEQAGYVEVVNAIVRGAVPGGPPGSLDPKDVEAAHHALSASQWIGFWGSHGYTLRHSSPTKG